MSHLLRLALLAVGLLVARTARAGDADRFGAPLPAHAVARLQAARLREDESARLQSKGRLWGAAFSPDGKRLLSLSAGTPVRYWDPVSGEELPRPEHPILAEHALVFAPDGKSVVAWTSGQPFRIHDPATGRLLRTLSDSKEVGGPLFAPGGKTIVAFDRNNRLCTWDAASGKLLHRHVLEDTVASLAFSPNGNTLALGCKDGSVRLWDPATGKETGRFQAHKGPVGGPAWSPDGKTLVTTGDGTLCRWDVAAARQLFCLRKVYYFADFQFTPDGKHLIGSDSGGLCLRDAATGRVLSQTNNYHSGARGIALTPDGKTVAWGEQGLSICMARIVGDQLRLVEPEKLRPLGLGFVRGGKDIVTVGDPIVRFWDAATGRELRRLPAEPHPLRCLALTADGSRLALGGRTVIVRDATSRRELWRRPAEGRIAALAFAPDGKRLAAADGVLVRVWDVRGKEMTPIKGRTDSVAALAFTPDGKTIVSAGEDRLVLFHDAATGAERGRLPRHDCPLSCVAVAPDGKTLAVGDWEGHVHLWALAKGLKPRQLPSPPAHEDNVAALVFSPDGRRLATAGWDGHIHVWDVAAGRAYLILDGHRDEVACLAFSPDGKRLASGSRDHTVLIWDTTGP